MLICVQLLAHGAAIDCRDRQGCSPLLIAAQYGFVEIIIYLLKVRALTLSVDSIAHCIHMHTHHSHTLVHANEYTSSVTLACYVRIIGCCSRSRLASLANLT